MKDKGHDEAMAEMYLKDTAFTIQLINDILENDDQGELLIVLRQIAKACADKKTIAEIENLNQMQVNGTPSMNVALSTVTATLKTIGLRLTVRPL